MHIRHSLLVIDHCSLVIASRRAEMCLPYPRSPLREFTPCAPGQSSPFYSLFIAHRLIVFASNHIHGAEAVTGPVLWCRFTGGDHVPQAAAQGKADFLSPAERPEIMASPSADPREPL